MTVKSFRDRFSSDADFAFSFMVGNNYEAIADNLRTGYGLIIESEDDVFDALNEMKAEGRYDDIVRVMNVPVITDGVDTAVLAVIQDVASGMRQLAKSRSKNLPTFGPDDDYTPPDAAETNGNGTTGAEDSGSGSGWTDVFGAIVSGFTTIWGAANPTGNLTNVNTTAETAAAAQQEAERKARNQRYIIIGVVVVVAIVGLWLAWKKWGK